MGTYRELQDRINLDYLNRTDLGGATSRAIANAIHAYEGRRFWFNEAQTGVAAVAAQSWVAVPSDFLELDRLEISYAGSAIALRGRPFDVIRSMNITSATSVPTHFAYRGDRFELALIPDSAYALTVYHLKSLPALSADADSNAWTTEAQNLIAHHATLDMLISVLHAADDARIAHHTSMLKLAWDELYTKNAVRTTRSLRPTRW